jgi:teichuronic acid biosynthesis glycosyltransferase TuaG
MKDLISVIIPYYKDFGNIKKSIKSALSQTYKNIEIIIVDDENSERSNEILQKLKKISKKIKILHTKKNNGVAAARNLGIGKSKGKFIAFLDSDDLWHKDKLAKQILVLKYKNIDICFTSYYAFINNKKILYKVPSPKIINYETLLKQCPISCSTILLKKKILNKIKFKNLKTKEDYLLWLELAKKGYRFFGVKNYLSLYRVRKKSLSSYHLNKVYSAFKIYSHYLKFNYFLTVLLVFRLYLNAFKKKYFNI